MVIIPFRIYNSNLISWWTFLGIICPVIRSNCSIWSAAFDSVETFVLFGCWVIIFGCFMGFDNLVTVFGGWSILTDCMLKMFG